MPDKWPRYDAHTRDFFDTTRLKWPKTLVGTKQIFQCGKPSLELMTVIDDEAGDKSCGSTEIDAAYSKGGLVLA